MPRTPAWLKALIPHSRGARERPGSGREMPPQEKERLQGLAFRNAYKRLKEEKLRKMPAAEKSGGFRTAFQGLKADAKNEAGFRAETAHLLRELRQKRLLGKGRGSDIFLKKPNKIRLLQKATSKGGTGEGTGYLKEMGVYGIIGHSFLRFFAARPYVKAKRKAVAGALEMIATVKSKNFRRFVHATARFLYDNYRNRGTAIFDPEAEGTIYEVFGRLARKNNDFKKIYNVEGETTGVGRQFFRYLIRENILGNFRFVKGIHDKPDFEMKMDAIRYCTVGDEVDPREKTDARRIDFIYDIFQPGNEVSVLDTYRGQTEKGRPYRMVLNNAMQALIGVQYKAKARHGLDMRETYSYFRKVCSYYGIAPEDVHAYARDLYYGPGRRRLEDYSNPERARLFQIREMVKDVYGFPTPLEMKLYGAPRRQQPTTTMPPDRQPPISLPPGGVTFKPSKRK